MAIHLSEFKFLVPTYLWYRKYNLYFSIFQSFLFFTKDYLPMIILSWYSNGSVFTGILFFYVYEIGYAFNDKELIKSNLQLSVRILFTILALFFLFFMNFFVGVGTVLIMLTFALHNYLPESSFSRILTWFILNIGKIYILGGFLGLLLFSNLIFKRLAIYVRKKIHYQIHYIYMCGVFFAALILLWTEFGVGFSLLFLIVNMYIFRDWRQVFR